MMCAVAGSALIADCKAGGIGQLDIEQYKTRLELLDNPQCLGAGLRLEHLISTAFEDAALGRIAALRCRLH
jgi:hypothetical protein